MFHMTQSLFKSASPEIGDILRQNPDIMRSVSQAAANNMAGNIAREEGDPSATTAGAFSFSAHWGNSPGFDLDDVTVETIEPVVGGPPLAITNLEYDPAALTSAITWNAVPGTRYFVYASSDLVNWEEIGIRTASGSEETLMEEEVSAGFRSYRVQDYPEP